jgi:chromosome segregation ATPase
MAKKAAQTMDMTQASQMLQWLDEERRNDKAIIATLQEQTRNQEEQLAQQDALIQDLQATTASIQSLISQVTDFEQTVSNYKNEMVFLLDQREEARKKEQGEADRLRKIEYESVSDHLGKLDKDAQTISRLNEALIAREAEDQRLSEALQRLEALVKDLDKRSDDRVQSVTYLEEQRRADNRRIAELEHDTTELRKKSETQTTKLTLLEDTIQKQKARIGEALEEMKALEKPIEELRISDFQREQKMKQYVDQGEQVAEAMEKIQAQTQEYVVMQQQVKRALEKTESFQGRIEKRQNEVAEMQRLAEDRVKRQWEEWQEGRDKELKKRQMILDEQWKTQETRNQEHAGQFKRLETQTNLHQTQIESMLDARRMDAHRGLAEMQDAVEQAEQSLIQAREAWRGTQE